MHNSGGSVVRLFLFVARQGIQLSETTPQSRGLDPSFARNLQSVLDIARKNHLLVYPTLFEGVPKEKGPVRTYFYNLLNNQLGEGDAFNSNVLAPLLTLLDKNKDVIFALDLMNEIDGFISKAIWLDSWIEPRSFVARTTAFVRSKSPWLSITASAGWGTAAVDVAGGLLSDVGLDFYDLHAYSDEGRISGLERVCERARSDGMKIILGEFGQKSHNLNDQLQTQVTSSFLESAKSSCFSGALAWRFDETSDWWRFQNPDGTLRPATKIMLKYSQIDSSP